MKPIFICIYIIYILTLSAFFINIKYIYIYKLFKEIRMRNDGEMRMRK